MKEKYEDITLKIDGAGKVMKGPDGEEAKQKARKNKEVKIW